METQTSAWMCYRGRRTAPCCISAVGFRPALPAPDKHVSAHPAFQIRLEFLPFSPSYSPFVMAAYCCPSGFRVPGISRPLCLVQAFLLRPGWSLLHRLLWVRCPCYIIGDLSAYHVWGDVSGSGVARTARSSSTVGALQYPYSWRTRPGSVSSWMKSP